MAQIGDYKYTNRALSLYSTKISSRSRYLPSLPLALFWSFLWVFGSPWTPLPMAMLSLPSISCLSFCRRPNLVNHSGSTRSSISTNPTSRHSLVDMTTSHAHSPLRVTFVMADYTTAVGGNDGVAACTARRVFCYCRGTSTFFARESRES